MQRKETLIANLRTPGLVAPIDQGLLQAVFWGDSTVVHRAEGIRICWSNAPRMDHVRLAKGFLGSTITYVWIGAKKSTEGKDMYGYRLGNTEKLAR